MKQKDRLYDRVEAVKEFSYQINRVSAGGGC